MHHLAAGHPGTGFKIPALKKLICIPVIILNLTAMAQATIEGEYYFRKQEMVSGFNFSSSGTFRFFYSYGAVDRSAEGSYSIVGDTVRLSAKKEAGKDFTVTNQQKNTGGYRLSFNHPNKYLLQNIRAIFIKDGKQEEAVTDSHGLIQVELTDCDSIFVQHLLYPDIATLVKDKDNKNNQFTLSLNPSLEQVSFKGIDLKIENDGTLSCVPNYLLPFPGVIFKKD